MIIDFRPLEADEVEARVSRITPKSVALLIYKNARIDQQLLDEVVGAMNWQKHYSRDNRNCTVSIWDEDKKQWIEKEDTGTESNTEAEKGLASDSFKRACFAWGLGRELYTAPDIYYPITATTASGGKCYDKFVITAINTKNKKIISVRVRNTKTKTEFEFTHNGFKQVSGTDVAAEEAQAEERAKTIRNTKISRAKAQALMQTLLDMGVNLEKMMKQYKVNSFDELTEAQHLEIIGLIKREQDKK